MVQPLPWLTYWTPMDMCQWYNFTASHWISSQRIAIVRNHVTHQSRYCNYTKGILSWLVRSSMISLLAFDNVWMVQQYISTSSTNRQWFEGWDENAWWIHENCVVKGILSIHYLRSWIQEGIVNVDNKHLVETKVEYWIEQERDPQPFCWGDQGMTFIAWCNDM